LVAQLIGKQNAKLGKPITAFIISWTTNWLSSVWMLHHLRC